MKNVSSAVLLAWALLCLGCGDDGSKEPGKIDKDASTPDSGHVDPPTDASDGPHDDAAAPVDGGPAVCTYGAHDVLITNNHPVGTEHALLIPLEDLVANPSADAESKTYSIHGMSDHVHMITLTPQDLATLAKGGTVTVLSTLNDGDAPHDHTVTILCF